MNYPVGDNCVCAELGMAICPPCAAVIRGALEVIIGGGREALTKLTWRELAAKAGSCHAADIRMIVRRADEKTAVEREWAAAQTELNKEREKLGNSLAILQEQLEREQAHVRRFEQLALDIKMFLAGEM